MPAWRMRQTKGREKLIPLFGALLLLGACVNGGPMDVTKFGFGRGAAPADITRPALGPKGEVRSQIIDDLQARRSILPQGGHFAQISTAIMQSDAGVAAAELRVARLRAEARSKNWLPKIGPSVTLNSLGQVAASLFVEMALVDHGRRKAERAFAAADVEIAAITLSAETNRRVYDGLRHYLTAQRARAQAEVAQRGVERLQGFGAIMEKRINGGLSDRSEAHVLSQKIVEMQAMLSADLQAESSALAELQSMTSQPLYDFSGIDGLPQDEPLPEPLSVLLARGEGARELAAADMSKADLLPSIAANATISEDGIDPGLGLGGGLFGLGQGAEREAIAATGDLVQRRSAEAAENSRREIVALSAEMQNLLVREAQGAEVLRQTGRNLEVFTEQYKVGRRSLLELVQQYEAFSRAERDQVALKYLAADLRLQIALARGVLVDGAKM